MPPAFGLVDAEIAVVTTHASIEQRHAHTRGSPVMGHKHNEGTGALSLRRG